MAWSDRPWVLDGASVRVAMVGFDDGSEEDRSLNGSAVKAIHADLTATVDLTAAARLVENQGLIFMGDTKVGAFELDSATARRMIRATGNPNGRPNRDVVRPWVNGVDVTRRPRDMWIIDFGSSMTEEAASQYEMPFQYVVDKVLPSRAKNNRQRYRELYWIHGEPRPGMREAVQRLQRMILTVIVAKHRLFVWSRSEVLPDHRLFVIARDDDYFFGVLHSRVHEGWSLALGSTLEDRPSYSSLSCFETFPFPWPPGKEPVDDSRVQAIAAVAKDLVEKRDRWLNPEGADEAELKKRTLTNLYNQRPTWLDLAHKKLDQAVLDAYAWPHDISNEDILERLLARNLERAAKENTKP